MTQFHEINLETVSPSFEGITIKWPSFPADANDAIPSVDPNYGFDEILFQKFLILLNMKKPIWIFGPHGSGKTSLVGQVAARLNQPIMWDNGSPDKDIADFTAMPGLKEGSSSTIYSALALAMKKGYWYVLNEASLLRSGILTSLNTVNDETRTLTIPFSGEVIKADPRFRFIVTDNSNGRGDFSGNYSLEKQNESSMDRFMFLEVGYQKKEAELKILERVFSKVNPMILESYVDFANDVRCAYLGKPVTVNENGSSLEKRLSISKTFSTRSLIDLITMASVSGKASQKFGNHFKLYTGDIVNNFLFGLTNTFGDNHPDYSDRKMIDAIGITRFGKEGWVGSVEETA